MPPLYRGLQIHNNIINGKEPSSVLFSRLNHNLIFMKFGEESLNPKKYIGFELHAIGIVGTASIKKSCNICLGGASFSA